MARPKAIVPKLCKHTPTGRGYVRLGGRCVYLGPFDDPATKRRYETEVAEWLARGRTHRVDPCTITLTELTSRFADHAAGYYPPRGDKPSREVAHFKQLTAKVVRLYGTSKAAEFGPLQLKVVRNELVESGLSRPVVNRQIVRLRAIFRWGVAEGLIPGSVLESLRAVPGLKYGRTQAPEPPGVRPVPDEIVDETLRHMTPTVRAMVRFIRATGCRPGECCALTTGDIVDSTGRVWIVELAQHKTRHHGHRRRIFVGPEGQKALEGFLKADLAAPIFSPKASYAEYLEARSKARKTPPCCGNRPGTNRVAGPSREPRDRWGTEELNKAVHAACDRAWPVPKELTDPVKIAAWEREHRWNVGQLRHSYASRIRREFSIDVAATLLGHAAPSTSLLYMERDETAAKAVALKIG